MRDPQERDVLSMLDLSTDLGAIVERALVLKAARRAGQRTPSLPGSNLGLIFEKPSTRTRTSFEVAINDLGGHAVVLSTKDLQLGRGETLADTARVLSRYLDVIAYRAFRHSDVAELARCASVPVVNALDDREHPCQIVADLLTLREQWDRFPGHRLAYVGDGNNVCNSLVLGCAMVGIDFVGAIPASYRPPEDILREARRLAAERGSKVDLVEDPADAARDADVIYTDVWVSMGDEAQAAAREKAFHGYQVNSALVRKAKASCRVMHDLPAHRGLEITDDVIDGPQSAVWDQAENRLHAEKALLEYVLAPEFPPGAL
jgi:ornithine carbamoyltransferase